MSESSSKLGVFIGGAALLVGLAALIVSIYNFNVQSCEQARFNALSLISEHRESTRGSIEASIVEVFEIAQRECGTDQPLHDILANWNIDPPGRCSGPNPPRGLEVCQRTEQVLERLRPKS